MFFQYAANRFGFMKKEFLSERSFVFDCILFAVICLAAIALQSCSKHKPSMQDLVKERTQQISEVSQFSTVEYTVKKVIKAEDNAWYKIGERKILFTCTAYLKAGVDLNNFSIQNVEINESSKSAVITLPHAELMSVNIPPDEIHLVYQKVGLLRSNFSAAQRNALIKQGEQDIINDIDNIGILQQAEDNATQWMKTYFKQLGFDNVTVKFYIKDEKTKL